MSLYLVIQRPLKQGLVGTMMIVEAGSINQAIKMLPTANTKANRDYSAVSASPLELNETYHI